MTESSRILIGSPVACSQGTPCGTVLRIVIDPPAGVITHLAVGPGHGDGHLVPFELVIRTGDTIELSCTKAEFDALASDQDRALVSDVAETFASTTPDHGIADAGLLSLYGEIAPTGITRPFPGTDPAPTTTDFDRVPAGTEQLTPAEEVRGTDGSIGRISGLAVDPSTRRITHLIIGVGHLWRRHQIAVPIAEVTHFGIGVQVGLTRQQMEELDEI